MLRIIAMKESNVYEEIREEVREGYMCIRYRTKNGSMEAEKSHIDMLRTIKAGIWLLENKYPDYIMVEI